MVYVLPSYKVHGIESYRYLNIRSQDAKIIANGKYTMNMADRTRSETSPTTEAKSTTKPATAPTRRPLRKLPAPHFNALVAYNDDYVQPLILSALADNVADTDYTLLPTDNLGNLDNELDLSSFLGTTAAASPLLLVVPYEAIPFALVRSETRKDGPPAVFANSYCFRKALIRKHYLAATVEHWVAKQKQQLPQEPSLKTVLLERHVKRSEAFELDYAEFLDDALTECWDLRASLARNEAAVDSGGSGETGGGKKEWWILKPGMGDRGQGIRLFSKTAELEAIFEEWEVDESDEEEEEAEDAADTDDDDGRRRQTKIDNDDGERAAAHDPSAVRASHLRHFVAQPYLDPPLLLASDRRKFHVRVYVACVGATPEMEVFVFRDMLALFAAADYVSPDTDSADLRGHLTNTCLQVEMRRDERQQEEANEDSRMETEDERPLVRTFWSLPLPRPTLDAVFAQICDVTGEVFAAAATGGMAAHFEPLANCFEAYGLDFLLTDDGDVGDDGSDDGAVRVPVPRAWLLEVNAFPDFRQSGTDDAPRAVVAGFWRGVVRRVVGSFFAPGHRQEATGANDEAYRRPPPDADDDDNDDDGMILVRRVALAKGGWGPRVAGHEAVG